MMGVREAALARVRAPQEIRLWRFCQGPGGSLASKAHWLVGTTKVREPLSLSGPPSVTAALFRMATFKIMNIAKGKVGFIEPMLAVAVTELPEPAWRYELKSMLIARSALRRTARSDCSRATA
jgi:hypothetical protein